MELNDIVLKLIGPVEPIGETYEDNRRYKNLEELIKLVDHLLYNIDVVATGKDRVEYSIKRAGVLADEFLKDVKVR